MKKVQFAICVALMAGFSTFSQEKREGPYEIQGYIIKSKKVSNPEDNYKTSEQINTIIYSGKKSIISEVKDKDIREIVINYVKSNDFIEDLSFLQGYGGERSKLKQNKNEIRLFKIDGWPIKNLYVMDFRGIIDCEAPISAGEVLVFKIENSKISQIAKEEYVNHESGEYTDAQFYGIVQNKQELIIKRKCVSGTLYYIFKLDNYAGKKEYYDNSTDGTQYFNPD